MLDEIAAEVRGVALGLEADEVEGAEAAGEPLVLRAATVKTSGAGKGMCRKKPMRPSQPEARISWPISRKW